MTVTRATFDLASHTYISTPFAYVSVPLLPGRQLDEDIEIYLACTARCGLMPNVLSCLFMGDDAEQLYLRRAETSLGWAAFQLEVVRRHPDVAAGTAAIIVRVAALATSNPAGAVRPWRPTTPELCVGAALLAALPSGVTVVADAALPGGRLSMGQAYRCDFHLVSSRHEERLEVAGLIDSGGRPRTFEGVRYMARTMVTRPAVYADLGLPPPLTLHADEVLDRVCLTGIIAGLSSRFAQAMAGKSKPACSVLNTKFHVSPIQ